MGVSPPVKSDGHDEFVQGLAKAMSVLGNIMGFGIWSFTIGLTAIELILNPIFLFAQAKANGVHIGAPLVSLSWWTIIVVTFATTGIQYALLQPGGDRKSLGYKIGWTIAIMDTLMDGAGFLAWANGGNVLKLSGDSSHLQFGILPPANAPMSQWVGWIFICAICLGHEPFLSQVLGRLSFVPGAEAGPMANNVLRWTSRAGKFHNRIKLISISFAPYIMMGLDVMLFPQSVKGQGSVIQLTWLILTVAVTLATITIWEYYNHLRSEGNYRVRELDRKHKIGFAVALGMTIFDSAFDLQGFNQVIYGKSVFFPTGLTTPALADYILTAGLVMLMCTAFEPMNSHLFGPLSRLAAMIPGYDAGPGDVGGDVGDVNGDGLDDMGGAGGQPWAM